MKNLVGRLDENGVVEEDDGPWVALVILATKPHQENFPWHEYHWRMCVYYQKLNQVNRPFTFPIPYCDYAVKGIDKESKYFIDVDMNSEYWKVVAEEEAREILELFNPDGKRQWKVMPMGDLN